MFIPLEILLCLSYLNHQNSGAEGNVEAFALLLRPEGE